VRAQHGPGSRFPGILGSRVQRLGRAPLHSVVRVAAPILVLVVSAAFASGGVYGAAPSSICSPNQLVDEMNVADSSVNSTLALSTAVNSHAYLAALDTLGSVVLAANGSVSEDWQTDLSTCSAHMMSVSVDFEVRTPAQQVTQVVVSETISQTTVVNATVQTQPSQLSSHTTYEWSGYQIQPCSACDPTGSYSQWGVEGLATPSGYCGASTWGIGWCEISFWSGLTAQPGGGTSGAPGYGIAQSGINLWEECQYEIFTYICTWTYQGWYQFFPQMQTGDNCIGISAANNEIISEVSWAPPNTYYATIWDVTTGAACSSSTTMAMDAPAYVQFQAENANSPTGGYYPIPHFSVTFDPAVARGDPLNLANDNPFQFNNVPGVSTNALQFNCGGSGESCFNQGA
jgi:hypothetical protein